MIILPSYPTYYDNDDAKKQIEVMRQYINSLKEELEAILSDIRYEYLDPSLRAKFDDIYGQIQSVQARAVTTDENINTNYTREADLEDLADDVDDLDTRVQTLEDDHVTEQDLQDVSDRVSNIEDADYQGQINGLDGRIDTLEDIDAGTRLTALEGIDAGTRLTTLETNSLTASNFNTKMGSVDAEVGTMKATSFKIGNDTFTKQTLTIDGTTFTFLGL